MPELLLAIVVLASLLIRGVHLANYLDGPLGNSEVALASSDMAAFATWAQQIAAGDWWSETHFHPYMDWMAGFGTLQEFEAWWGGKEIFHQNPLYPYVLALSYLCTSSAVPMLVLQMLLSTVGVVLVFALARRFADAWAGLFAAVLAACFAPSIVFDTFLLRVSMNSFLTLAGLWLLVRLHDRPSALWGGVTGVALAAGYMLRPTGLLLMVAAPILLALLFPDLRAKWRRWLPAMLVGSVLVVAPFVVRNLVVGAPALAFSTRGPETVIQSQTKGADPAFMTLPEKPDFRAYMDAGSGSLLGAIGTAIDSWPDGAWSSWLNHEWQKVICVFRDMEYLNNVNFYYHRRVTPLLAWLPTFGWFVGLGFVGVFVLAIRGRDRRLLWFGLVACGALLIGAVLGFALGRYRLPLAVLMTIPAGAAVVEFYRLCASRRVTLAGLLVGAAVLVSLLSYQWYPKRMRYEGAERLVTSATYRPMYEEISRLRHWDYMTGAQQLKKRGADARAVAELSAYIDANVAVHDRWVNVTRALPMATEYLYLRTTFVSRCQDVAKTLREWGDTRRADAIDKQIAPMLQEIRRMRGG